MGLENEILIPTHKQIHSNNERTQEVIAAKNYAKRTFEKPKRFSHKFPDYAWINEVFVVPPVHSAKSLAEELDHDPITAGSL